MHSLSPKKLEQIQALLEKEGLKTAAGERIGKRSLDAPASLSFGQERLWFVGRMAPDSPVFHIPAAYRIDGPLDVARLEEAWRNVCARHESLRTRFVDDGGRPALAIDAPDAVVGASIDVVDRSTAAAESVAASLSYARARAAAPFDLARGPVARLALVRRAPEEHLLVVVIHHIVAEVQSLGILVRDLASAYRVGGTTELPALDIQFTDVAAWQRERMSGERYAEQLAWWRARLAGELPVLQLPTDRPRPAVQSFAGGTASRDLAPAAVAKLRELCATEKVTPFAATLALWSALLSRYSGQDDVLVGVPTTDRQRVELEHLIGFFVNMLPIRVDLSGDKSFRDVLREASEFHRGAQAQQELPFERLVEELGVERDLSRSPLVQVAFLYQTALESQAGASELGPGTTLAPIDDPLAMHTNTSKFDASLIVWDHGDAMSASVEYAADLFDASTIEHLLGHFERLLTEAALAPDAPLASHPILTAEEEQRILVDWNTTAADIRDDACVDALFEEQVDLTPDRLAVAGGGVELTYRQLDERANKLAHRLRALGVTPDRPVAIATGRAPEMLVGILGTLKAGGAYLPIDLAYPRERLAFTFEDADVAAILTLSTEASALPQTPNRTRIELDTDWASVDAESPERLERVSRPTNLAYVIYTSGSTGTPKGVALEHTGLVNLSTWHQRAYDVQPEDRATHLAGLAFDASVWEVWPYLLAGSSLHLVPEDVRLAPTRLIAWLVEQRITQSFLPTPLAEAVLREDIPFDFPLEVVLTGGDKLRRAPGQSLPFRLVNHYGPTENTVVATATDVTPVLFDDETSPAAPPPIGRPIDNVQVYVLDRGGQAVPVGVPGELTIGGTSLARGYFGRPDLTAEKFVAHPVRGLEGRIYRTGDLVRWRADGELEFLGRMDGQVKVRGFRIELGEIEAQVGKHEHVADCAVVIRHDDAGEATLIGYAVAAEGAELSSDELRGTLRATLPEYMVPTTFVLLDELPLTPNGKVDRRALPDPDLTSTTDEFVDPEGALEEQIASVWRELLGVDAVSASRNFFDLGGHSLLLAQVHARLQDSIEPEPSPPLSIVELFRHPTIHSLAAHLATRSDASNGAAVEASRDRGARRREALQERAATGKRKKRGRRSS